MIIKLILIALLGTCIVYVSMQKNRPAFISNAISLIAVCAIVLVVFPDLSTIAAHAIGVRRGADLVIYLWIVTSFALIINLQLKLLNMHRDITDLARQVAIGSARTPKEEAQPSDAD